MLKQYLLSLLLCFSSLAFFGQFSSPYTINAKKELPFIASGLGLLSSGIVIREIKDVKPFTQSELNNLDGSRINSFDRPAIYNNSLSARNTSDILQFTSLALPSLFLINKNTRKNVLPLFIIGVEVYSITAGLTLVSKYGFNRARPLAYNSSFSFNDRTSNTARLSFISGHTSTSAALSVFTAKVITDFHPDMKKGIKIGLWSVALALPAATGYYRVKGGKHFKTDVITGYAVGAIVGWLVPHLHKHKNSQKLSINTFNQDGMNGLTLNWKL